MAINRRALGKAGVEAGIQLLEEIPFVSSLIEGVRKYQEVIQDEQRHAFVEVLAARVGELEASARTWYSSPEGEVFVKKVVATALNAEYGDKLDFLVNAFVNGPSLRQDDAKRVKFVEMIRQLSKPSLELLVASVRLRPKSEEVVIEELASELKWHPSLVDACIREVQSLGGYSPITKWETGKDGNSRPIAQFMGGLPGISPITREFAAFISNQS